MDGAVRPSWVDACADRHLRPLVLYLRPPIVIGMGSCGWRAVRRAFALDDAPERISQAAGSCWTSVYGTCAFAVGHPGPQGSPTAPGRSSSRIGGGSARRFPRLCTGPFTLCKLRQWLHPSYSARRASKRRPHCRSFASDQTPRGATTRRSWRSARTVLQVNPEQIAAGDVWVATAADRALPVSWRSGRASNRTRSIWTSSLSSPSGSGTAWVAC